MSFREGRLDLDALAWEVGEQLRDYAEAQARVARATGAATRASEALYGGADPLLLSVPGMGPVTAPIVRAHLGDVASGPVRDHGVLTSPLGKANLASGDSREGRQAMSSVVGESSDANMAGVVGRNTVDGVGIWGEANPGGRAIVGVSTAGAGVWGHTASGRGVVGASDSGVGVWGANKSGRAIVGAVDEDGTGVWGEVKTGTGVVGYVHEGEGAGVSGRNDSGDGIMGVGRRGVVGISETYQGVYGKSRENAGLVGESDQMHAVYCVTHSSTSAGVYATNTGGGKAALFEGDVVVTGDLVLAGADVAEQFDVAPDGADLASGAVAVLDDEGRIAAAKESYDGRVVGIVSGAGDRVPALVLDRTEHGGTRRPIAVAGKAWCLADATTAPIRVGDLLTTSARPGHSMRVTDRLQAIGATIGKALTPLEEGTGHVLVLVSLG